MALPIALKQTFRPMTNSPWRYKIVFDATRPTSADNAAADGDRENTPWWKYTVYCVATIRGRMSGQRDAAHRVASLFEEHSETQPVLNTRMRSLEIRECGAQSIIFNDCVESTRRATRALWLEKKSEAKTRQRERTIIAETSRDNVHIFGKIILEKVEECILEKYDFRRFYLFKVTTDCSCKLSLIIIIWSNHAVPQFANSICK